MEMTIDIHELKSRYDGIPIDLLLSKTFNKDQVKNTIKNVVENKFNGKISSASLYNRALTDAEIIQNFNSKKDIYGL